MSTSAELAAASARSGDAAPMDGERAPLLRAGASATPSSCGGARLDRGGSPHAPSRGVFAALGALAACGIIAVVYGASRASLAHASRRAASRGALSTPASVRATPVHGMPGVTPPSRDPHVPPRATSRADATRERALSRPSLPAFAHASKT
jgi:hypothetical protein